MRLTGCFNATLGLINHLSKNFRSSSKSKKGPAWSQGLSELAAKYSYQLTVAQG